MTDHKIVELHVDTALIVRAMRRAAAAVTGLRDHFARQRHNQLHHRRETPARTAMHGAYDRRRRARRRRR